MELKPFQRPYPPLWVAGSPIKAADMGSNLVTEGTIKELPSTIKTYSDNFEKRRRSSENGFHFRETPLLGVSKRIFVGDTDNAAMERAKESYEIHISNYTKPLPGGLSRRPRVMVEGEIVTRILPWTVNFETAILKKRLIAGSTQTVTAYLQRYHQDNGTNFLLLSFQWGDLSHEEAVRTMKVVANEFIQDPSVTN